MKSTCPNDIRTCPQKEKELFFVLKVYVHNTLLACPIRAMLFLGLSKCLPESDFYLGNQASAYVAPCYLYIFHIHIFLEGTTLFR